MRLFLALLLLSFSADSFAADITFVVYHSKGSVKKYTGNAALKKGDKLLAEDQVTLGASSQLVLLCSNLKVIEISEAGRYTVKSLLSKCKQAAASYNMAYFKYVWEQFTRPEGAPGKNPADYMKNVGAVSRGCNEVVTSVKTDTLHFYPGHFPVYWNAAYDNSFAVIYNQAYDGAPLNKIALVNDQPFLLSALVKGLPAGEYYWQIEGSNGGACERKYLQLWEKQTHKQALAALLKEMPTTSKAERAFAYAFVLEENYFMSDALRFYKRAVKLDPTNPIYKKSLEKFYEKQL